MALIQFVQNHQDLSTDRGYQFKFFCDKCHNGFMTHFQTSAMGVAETALNVASSLFGGVFGSASRGAYEVQRAIGGKAHDAAFETAVQEGKGYFRQCTRCGKWVCPEVCWNEAANMCEGCAPRLAEEMASAHAQAKAAAARAQINEMAAKVDYASGVDMSKDAVLRAPPVQAAPPPGTTACGGCGTGMAPAAKFCPNCGTPRPLGCTGCGNALIPGMKFCAQCGAKAG